MNTATIITADKGQRSALANLVTRIRAFAIELYAAHGGWFVLDAAQPASGALAAQRRARLKAIAK
jgi:hypothetical protein